MAYTVKPRGYTAKAHHLFSVLFEMRATEGGAAKSRAVIGPIGLASIRLARKWAGRVHDGRFYGVYYRNDAGKLELCEFDGGVCYEAHRDADDARAMFAATMCDGIDKTRYEIHPIPAGQRCADPVTETVVESVAHVGDFIKTALGLSAPRARPDHLFLADNGDLYDTRDPQWHARPLRRRFWGGDYEIETTAQFKAALRAGQSTDLGGYPLYFIMGDGETLSFEGARQNVREIIAAMLRNDNPRDEWRVLYLEINFEAKDLRCVHTNKRIPSAHGDDETEETTTMDDEIDLSGALLFADSARGVYIPQHFAESVQRQHVTGVSDEDYSILLSGQDHEHYWETWEGVLNNARLTIPETGKAATLHHDGDLWVVPTKEA